MGYEADGYSRVKGPLWTTHCLHYTGPAGPHTTIAILSDSLTLDQQRRWYSVQPEACTQLYRTATWSYPIAVAILYCYTALYCRPTAIHFYTAILLWYLLSMQTYGEVCTRISTDMLTLKICLFYTFLEGYAYSLAGSLIGSYSSFHMRALSHRIQCIYGGSPLSE